MNAVSDQTLREAVSGDSGSRIDPVLARSWLLVNGAQYERFGPAAHSRADIVVLDIEDGGPEGQGDRPRERDPLDGRRQQRLGACQRVRNPMVGR